MAKPSRASLDQKFGAYYPIAEAIVGLLHPYAEVVLHDVASGRVVRIWNAFSSRKAGDFSHLEGAPDLFPDSAIIGPYEKALSKGGRTKSITATLSDSTGRNVGFFCINLDVSVIDTAASMLTAFASPEVMRPEPIYRNDLQEHINYMVRDFLLSLNKTIELLDRRERALFVTKIDQAGLFQARNSVPLVAKAIGLSRASVYNILAGLKRGDIQLPAEPKPANGPAQSTDRRRATQSQNRPGSRK
jgi:predicted transcriptional regulator YheO